MGYKFSIAWKFFEHHYLFIKTNIFSGILLQKSVFWFPSFLNVTRKSPRKDVSENISLRNPNISKMPKVPVRMFFLEFEAHISTILRVGCLTSKSETTNFQHAKEFSMASFPIRVQQNLSDGTLYILESVT